MHTHYTTSHHSLHRFFSDLVDYCCFGQVAVIQAEVSVKQKDCENDLAKAEPSLTAATAALHTLNKVLHFINQNPSNCMCSKDYKSNFINAFFPFLFLGESY